MPTPKRFDSPQLTLTFADATTLELKCHSNAITLGFDENTDGATFCSPDGARDDYIEVEILQSFGTDGLWTLLAPHALETADFTFVWNTEETASTVDNPTFAGKLTVPRFAPGGGEIRGYSSATVRMNANGPWTYDAGAGPVTMT